MLWKVNKSQYDAVSSYLNGEKRLSFAKEYRVVIRLDEKQLKIFIFGQKEDCEEAKKFLEDIAEANAIKRIKKVISLGKEFHYERTLLFKLKRLTSVTFFFFPFFFF